MILSDRLESIRKASVHWDAASAALQARDYPAFDEEMRRFNRIKATWKQPREAGVANNAPASDS